MSAPQFIVEGSQPLAVAIHPSGNKNAALPIIAAALLTEHPVTLENVPRIRDVETLVQLVRSLGVRIDWTGRNALSIEARDLRASELDPRLSARIRASILLAAPLLARCGEVTLPPPGGDVIGRRRVDTHFLAFEQLGATFALDTAYHIRSTGLRGADVRALQVELRRLKHHGRPTGRYDRRTATAVRKVRAAAGTVRPDGTLPLAQVLWLPAPAVTPDACKLVPGTFVSAGGVFATSAPRLTSVTVDAMPQRTVRGARVIKLMGATGPLGDDGTATDAAFRAKVAGGQEYRLFAQSGSTDEITAVIRLRHPVPTLKVPPGAVFGVRDDRGCVASAGRAYPVRIMGSRLGATLVTMDGAAPSSVDLGTAADHSACG